MNLDACVSAPRLRLILDLILRTESGIVFLSILIILRKSKTVLGDFEVVIYIYILYTYFPKSIPQMKAGASTESNPCTKKREIMILLKSSGRNSRQTEGTLNQGHSTVHFL